MFCCSMWMIYKMLENPFRLNNNSKNKHISVGVSRVKKFGQSSNSSPSLIIWKLGYFCPYKVTISEVAWCPPYFHDSRVTFQEVPLNPSFEIWTDPSAGARWRSLARAKNNHHSNWWKITISRGVLIAGVTPLVMITPRLVMKELSPECQTQQSEPYENQQPELRLTGF